METSTSRVYLVGLPVGIEVSDDGTVTYQIDTAEAGMAIRESDEVLYDDQDEPILIPDDVRERDAAAADTDHDRRFAESQEN